MALPWMKLWVEDLDRDCNALSLRARGAWLWIIFDLRKHGGSRSLTLSQWAQVVRSSEEEFSTALDELSQQKICDSSVTKTLPSNARSQTDNALITVTCRRLVREAKEKDQNILRQQRFRAKRESNAENNAPVTLERQKQRQITEAEAEVCSGSFSGSRPEQKLSHRYARGKNYPTTTTTQRPAAAFVLTPELRQWSEAAAPDIDPEAEAEKFVDYYGRDGTTFVDLSKAFRNWMRQAIVRARSPARRESVQEHNERISRELEAMDENEIRVMQGLDPLPRSS